MTRKLFLTDAKFKEMVPVSKNVEVAGTVSLPIFEAQRRFIEPVLCKDFYTEILDLTVEVRAGTNSFTTIQEDLVLNYIQPAVAWYAYYILIPINWSKTRDAGQVTQSGDYYATVTKSDILFLQNQAQSFAEDAIIRLKKFLDENRDEFPTYQSCNECDSHYNIGNKYFMAT